MDFDLPDLRLLQGVVAPDILMAMRQASVQLTQLGIRHALVGGLAVGAYGYSRATKDVDFLVGPEGFVKHGAIVTFRDGVPIKVGTVPIDPILRSDQETFLDEAITIPAAGSPPIAPVEALVYMKLRSPRRKDEVDVIELLKVSRDGGASINEYIQRHAPDLLVKLEKLVQQAADEEGF